MNGALRLGSVDVGAFLGVGWDSGVWEGLEVGFVGGRVSLVWCSLHLELGSLGLIQVQGWFRSLQGCNHRQNSKYKSG